MGRATATRNGDNMSEEAKPSHSCAAQRSLYTHFHNALENQRRAGQRAGLVWKRKRWTRRPWNYADQEMVVEEKSTVRHL
jgi:hypothetical protein